MPHLMSYPDPGAPKPGALVLMETLPCVVGQDGVSCAYQGAPRLPMLITQNYGRGRTAVFAAGGSWVWQMQMPLEDKSHEMFWQQLLRWLVKDTPSRVVASTPKQVLADESNVKLRAEVRDRTYLPAADATVEAHVLGPEGLADTFEMRPDPAEPGAFSAEWTAPKAGSYLVEMVAKRPNEEPVRDVITFRREDGVAESFHAEQNRELLTKLSAQTGGRYYTPSDATKLATEISFSEAGITVREMKDLWDMPAVFLLVILLRASDWLLRRKWGVI
jgi:hypothetical protein